MIATRGGGLPLPPNRAALCVAAFALLTLDACSKPHRVEPVDINGIAIDAQSDIDNYAAVQAASGHRTTRGPQTER